MTTAITTGLADTGLLVCLVMAVQPGHHDQKTAGRDTAVADSRGDPAADLAGLRPASTPPAAPSAASSAGARTPTPDGATSRTLSPTTSVSRSAAPRSHATSPLAGRIRPKSTYCGVATAYKAGVGTARAPTVQATTC